MGDAWEQFAQQTVFLWTLLMLPLFITLETALLGNLEHANGQWKHLFALPTSRLAQYTAKQIMAMVLIAISMVALYIYIIISGLVLRMAAPGLGLEAAVPWTSLLRYIGYSFLTSWLIISIHTWIVMRWRSFVVPIAVGVAAMVVAVVVFQSDYHDWYPWTLAGMIPYRLEEGLSVVNQVVAGMLGGIAVAALGDWDVIRRDTV